MKMILKMTREVYNNFFDYEGNMREKPIGTIAKMDLDQERIDLLRRYIIFIMESGFVSDIAKIFIKSNLTYTSSVAASIKYYNKTHPQEKEIKIKAAQSSTDYAANKLTKYFDDDML